MKSIYKAICLHLKKEKPVILATIIDSRGPTPRKASAKMAIFEDGSSLGSVGGGALEAEVEKIAKKLWSQKGATLKLFKLDNESAASLGMICGGEQQVLLTLITPDKNHQQVFETLAQTETTRNQKYLVTHLEGRGPNFNKAQMTVIDKTGYNLGYKLPSGVQSILINHTSEQTLPSLKHFEGYVCLVEQDYSQGTLYVFGAGHVAKPTVAIASMVGFQTIVLDDRPEFANPKNFPKTTQTMVIPDFNKVLENLHITDDAYLVIITRGHAHDIVVLEQALATPATYIGMIGSNRKVNICFQTLLEGGCSKNDIARVYAPIGIDIESETPEEIAVSIVAQLIQVRAKQLKR